MEDFVRRWLLDPMIGRLIALVVGMLVIIVVVRLVNRSLKHIVRDAGVRYRSRKFVVFIGYIIAALVVTTVYSNRLGGLAVAFGVAGAVIAFALQEVIASVAGWVAISFAGFYNPGDRVQLGGIKGDVNDVSILRHCGGVRKDRRRVAFASMTVQLVEMPALEVRLKQTRESQ